MWAGQPQYYVQPGQPPGHVATGHVVATGQAQAVAVPNVTSTPQSQTSTQSSETGGAGKRSYVCLNTNTHYVFSL